MPDDTKPAIPQLGEPTESKDFRSAYANHVAFDATAYEITLAFGNMVKKSRDGVLVGVSIENHTAIQIAWAQAKISAILFMVNVAAWEDANGTITIPKGVIPNLPDEETGLPTIAMAENMIRRYHEHAKQTEGEPKKQGP